MAYLANNHKSSNNTSNNTNNNISNNGPSINQNGNWKNFNQKLDKNGNWTDTQNGFDNENKYKNEGAPKDGLKQRFENLKYKQKKEAARKAITTAANAAGPIGGIAADAALKTKKGDKYLDAYAEADSHAEGMSNVKKEIKKDKRKLTVALFVLGFCLPLLFLLLFLVLIFKNADSQIFSNDNGGTVESENYIDDKIVNIFANYPGLYENIMDKVKKVSDEYQTEIDKYLVIATLVAPISNELIVPVEDNSCGEEKCYYFKGESKTWTEFLKSWSDQAELLSKMQLLTYINNQNELRVSCGAEQTMEQYAKNDLPINTFPWWGWLNPANWFKGFRDAAAAEVNAKCVDANNGPDSIVPTVRVLSIDQGNYYVTYTNDREYDFVKDPDSGGVYFWNLINKNGFIHEYLKDYLSSEYSDDPDKNYEINKQTIVDTVNYIYSYYQSIRKDCNTYPVIKGELKKVNFREDKDSQIYSLDFEDVFVGGSVLATYGGATGEVAKAQAILTRSEAYNYIVEQGKDVITGTSKMGCWWWKYNPTYDPSYADQKDNPNYDPDYPKIHYPEIYKAVTETRGVVVTNYGKSKVLETEYDAFCPTTRDPMDGFYYLPDGQRYLPIEYARFWEQSWSECPCFQNEEARPQTEFAESFQKLLNTEVGTPAQTTSAVCWEETGEYKVVSTNDNNKQNGKTGNTNTTGNNVTVETKKKILYGYHYKPTGGHGRGVSQHGMAYFAQFGYDHKALIRLFIDREDAGASFKRYGDSIEVGECENYAIFNEKDYE